MAKTLFFSNWQFKAELPALFEQALNDTGRTKVSERAEDCSVFNRQSRGKQAALCAVVLKAVCTLAKLRAGTKEGAAGYQADAKGNILYYCLEYPRHSCTYLVVYNPNNGRARGCLVREDGGDPERIQRIWKNGEDGEQLLAALVYASIEKDGKLYNEEFATQFRSLAAMLAGEADKDPEALLHAAFVCCDNLYRRIENSVNLGADGIPVDMDLNLFDTSGYLAAPDIRSGIFSPNMTRYGKFRHFHETSRKTEYEIREMKDLYGGHPDIPEKWKPLIPALPDTYKVGSGAERILRSIRKSPARTYMITGSAGVGKTTDAQLIAQVLGVPYFVFTCGPGTDEMDITATMIPNTAGGRNIEGELPELEDLLMDPATALMKVSGEYREGISREESFAAILDACYRKGCRMAKEKDFVMVDSPIVEGCKGPSVIEIQEPTLMERPATLAKLNALLDDSARIELLDGRVIHRHPETVIILTTNLHYIGCHPVNESILSRIRVVQHRENLTKDQMIDRVMRKTGFGEKDLLWRMAETVERIQTYIKDEDIRGGLCEYREFEDWVLLYMVTGDVIAAAKDTIVAKASMDPVEREEILSACVLPGFAAGRVL